MQITIVWVALNLTRRDIAARGASGIRTQLIRIVHVYVDVIRINTRSRPRRQLDNIKYTLPTVIVLINFHCTFPSNKTIS